MVPSCASFPVGLATSLRVAQAAVECIDRVVDVGFGDAHRRLDAQDVAIQSALPDEDRHLSQRLEQVDLYRVNDYAVERPFSQRLLGTGNLLLKTADKSSPEISLRGIKTDVVALYERVRAATELDKSRRGVRLVDNE